MAMSETLRHQEEPPRGDRLVTAIGGVVDNFFMNHFDIPVGSSHLDRVAVVRNELRRASLEDVVALAGDLRLAIHSSLDIPEDSIRKERQLHPESVVQYLSFIKSIPLDTGIIEGQRHGKQALNETTRNLSGAAQKMEQMREKSNMTDDAEPESLVEAAEDGLITLWVLAQTGRNAVVEASPNYRAKQVAATKAHVLGVKVVINDDWQCDNYPPVEECSNEALQERLHTTDGTIPFEQPIIDDVFGKGRYSTITTIAQQAQYEAFWMPNTIRCIVGHTQTLAALRGQPGRLGFLGKVVKGDNDISLVLEEGYYST